MCYELYLDRVDPVQTSGSSDPGSSIGRYNERYIFVTGCDTGFGHELAKRLDRLGCHVFAGCLTEKGETELNKICSDRLHTIPLDVSKHESVLKAYELVKSKIPEGRGM